MRLAKLFRERNYALVHCNNTFSWQPQVLLAAWTAGKPLLGHYRSVRPVSRLDRELARIPECIAAINGAVAGHLKNSGIRTPVVVCRDVIQPHAPVATEERLRVRATLARDDELLLGTVSRLEDAKGIEDLLVAVRMLQPGWPQLACAIVGEGAKAETFKRMAAAAGLGGRIRFTGFVPNDVVNAYYACMDVFVCPSLAEGGPLTVLEAMQMGCPVISTRVGQVPEVIRSGENGIIVDPGNPEALARAINSLLADPVQRRDMASRGVETARGFTAPVASARELDQAFTDVLARTGRDAGCS
jgi:glycosyltransferase involved in cell wall biosynthesis